MVRLSKPNSLNSLYAPVRVRDPALPAPRLALATAVAPSPFPARLPAHAPHRPVVVGPAVAAMARVTTTTIAARRPAVVLLPTAASPVRVRRVPALPRAVLEIVLPRGEGHRVTSVAALATVVVPGATLSPPAGRARAPSRLGLARARALVRSTLPLRTPVAGAVRDHLAGPAEATVVTISGTVGPGRPKIECSKFCQFSCCPYVFLWLGSLCKNIRVKLSGILLRYSKCTYYLVSYGQSLVVESSSARNGLHEKSRSV